MYFVLDEKDVYPMHPLCLNFYFKFLTRIWMTMDMPVHRICKVFGILDRMRKP